MEMPREYVEWCRSREIDVTVDVQARLVRFVELLLQAAKRINLIARHEPEEMWPRHVLDSLALAPFLDDAKTLIDVGSGGGLPGMVLAIQESARHFTLLEATAKKCRFLEEVAQALELENVTVVCARAEAAGRMPAFRDRFDVATARAVASLPGLLELTSPFVRPGGSILAMKGERVAREIDGASMACRELGLSIERVAESLPGIHRDACVVIAHKTGPTPEMYPRRNGMPVKRPL